VRALILAIALIAPFTACTERAAPKKVATAKPAKRSTPGVQEGLATWYGGNHHGGPTASGEKFDKHAMTAAHRTLPMNTRVKVTNKKNGRSVELRINDRGPYGNRRRIIDVSEGAAKLLDMIEAGVVPVRVEVLR
jgi:rare lipoprotein A